ncbi:MAG: pilus assembly protein PilP [Thermodesulfobacteriota bacterium]
MNFYKLMRITLILLTFLTVSNYDSFAEKPQDSTDSALVDGVKVIQDTNAENTVSETTTENVETMEDQGLEVEVDKGIETNTVQEIQPDTGTGPNPDLLVPQPRINLESNLDKPLYSPTGKRDPFKPFIKTPKEKAAVITATTPPIKRFPLAEYRIVGIVWVENEPKAMVVDPEKNTYFLGKSDEIGNKNGVIVEVNENGLLVSEKRFFEDVFGEQKVEVKKSVLAFADEDE